MSCDTADAAPLVVKLGGSLLDLPDLGERLAAWLRSAGDKVLLVPGGGPAADVIRVLDQQHRLGEERAHWLALAALTLNARFLAALLLDAEVIEDLSLCTAYWARGLTPILDPYTFAVEDEKLPGRLPHSWLVTSDSLAARVAVRARARGLVLLKSVDIARASQLRSWNGSPEPSGWLGRSISRSDWEQAAAAGLVDPYFPQLLEPGLLVTGVNLRTWRPERAPQAG